MAERRMFAKAVIGSGKFLRMPATARLLYYDLGMEADDDGIVEAFRVMRTTGANEDDLKILMARGLVRVLNDELVTQIIDWKRNNLIKNDRYHPSIYADLIQAPGSNMDPEWFQNVSRMEPEVRLGEDSIGKDSSGKDNISASNDAKPARAKRKMFSPPTVDEVAAYCAEAGYGSINPEAFVDYYEARGWKIGSQSMKDWRATVRNWARRDAERQTQAAENDRDPMLAYLDKVIAGEA